MADITLDNVFLAIANIAFNVSHSMLAEKYVSAKHRAVSTLEQQQDQADLPATHQTAYKCLFYLNIALPVSNAVVEYFVFKYDFQNGSISLTLNTINAIVALLMNALLIISGVILVHTVLAIRRFYKQRNAVNALATGALVRHASAFALFLLAVFVFSVAVFIASVKPSPLAYAIENFSIKFYAITSFISQVLLCTILWSLGTNLNREQTL
jgi:hypothetical protein